MRETNSFLPPELLGELKKDDNLIRKIKTKHLKAPKYRPASHYLDVARNSYFKALSILRHYLRFTSDYYFTNKVGAKNIDLFMFTPSVSSPSGPGSDSKPIPFRFGKLETFLTDSSQFGFEPLLVKNFERVYAYSPSMRGEKPDERHLNQFFHWEFEMVGSLGNLMPIIENYIKTLCQTLLLLGNTLDKLSRNPEKTRRVLNRVINAKNFPAITFEEAARLLIKNGYSKTLKFTKHGRILSGEGEVLLTKLVKMQLPLWVEYFDRNTAAFYQKPHPNNSNKVLNADLIFPPTIKGGYGGEIVGSGQRQDNVDEIYESLRRQQISPKSYEWYISLRKLSGYHTTAGFGLGMERFITWALGFTSIRDVILYPRLKNVRTYP